MPILATIMTVLEVLSKAAPIIVQVGTDLKPFAVDLYRQFKGEELTDDERAELERQVDALYARSQQPLPPAQPGDPDYKG